MKILRIAALVLAATATSCSALFWTSNEVIPSEKVVPSDRLNVQVFDAHGIRSRAQSVQLEASQQGDSTYFTNIIVPKYSEVRWQAKPTNYLWIASTADTSVYRLTYATMKPKAIPTLAGLGVMVLGLATLANDWGATLGVGAVITVYGGIADLIGLQIHQMRVKRELPTGIRREFRLKGVEVVPMGELEPAVARGITAYSDSLWMEYGGVR